MDINADTAPPGSSRQVRILLLGLVAAVAVVVGAAAFDNGTDQPNNNLSKPEALLPE